MLEKTEKGIIEFARSLGDIDVEVLRVGMEIGRLHHQIERQFESEMARLGLTPRQFEIMENLFHHDDGELTPCDLSEEVILTRSAITSALDGLEKLGYIRRTPHPKDRRKIALSLTPEGREHIQNQLPERYRKFYRVIRSLTPEERTLLVRFHKTILEVMAPDAHRTL